MFFQMAIDYMTYPKKCIHCFHSVDLYVKRIGKYPTLTYRSSICQDLDKRYPVILAPQPWLPIAPPILAPPGYHRVEFLHAIPAISPASQLIPVELPRSSVLVPIKALEQKLLGTA